MCTAKHAQTQRPREGGLHHSLLPASGWSTAPSQPYCIPGLAAPLVFKSPSLRAPRLHSGLCSHLRQRMQSSPALCCPGKSALLPKLSSQMRKAPKPQTLLNRAPGSVGLLQWFSSSLPLFMLGTGPAKKLGLPVVVESRSNSKGKELAQGWKGIQGKSKRAALHSLSRAGARFQTASCQEAALNSVAQARLQSGATETYSLHPKPPQRGSDLCPAPTRPPRTGTAPSAMAGWCSSRDLSYCSWASLIREAITGK